MDSAFVIEILEQRLTRRNRVLEFKVWFNAKNDHFLGTATSYGPDIYFNLPANPQANAFIAWLVQELGPVAEPPIIKCSARWGDDMVGPMQTVIWRLDDDHLNRYHVIFPPSPAQGEDAS